MRSLAAISVAFGVAFAATGANATTLLIDTGQCGNGGSCVTTNGTVTATAYLPTEIQPVNGNTGWANFQAAFNSWNATVGSAWTLATGALSAEAIFTVDLYRPFVSTSPNPGNCAGNLFCGGAEIDILYNNGGNAPNPIPNPIPSPISNLSAVWSQSVLTNSKLLGSQPGNPYIDNNNPADRVINPPAYPYQYTLSDFYDKPNRNANAMWLGDAWISTADFSTDTLTVYDGVEWGFSVVTPLPAALPLFATGLGALGLLGRRRKRKAQAAA
jgi:hypothetical protein